MRDTRVLIVVTLSLGAAIDVALKLPEKQPPYPNRSANAK